MIQMVSRLALGCYEVSICTKPCQSLAALCRVLWQAQDVADVVSL